MLTHFSGKTGAKTTKRDCAPKFCTAQIFSVSGILHGAKINMPILTNLETEKKEKNTLYNIINI